MPANTEIKTALAEARKPLLAWVGATDLAYDRLRTQLRELPAETQTRVRKLQERAQGGVPTLDPAEVTARVRQAVETYASQAKETYDSYREQAREQYETLSHRGELVVRRLRRRPEVRAAFAQTEKLLGRAEKVVEQTEEEVTGKPASTTTQARKTAPARKAPARKTTSTSKA